MERGVATDGGDLLALGDDAIPGLLERDGVIEAMGRLLAGARVGAGGALLVIGEAGLGKTAVCRRAMGMADGTFRLGVGRGDPIESGVAFGVVSQALHDLGVPDPLQAVAAEGSAMDVAAARLAGVRAALGGSGRPTLVVLEDLHWADPDSLALLSYLCRRLPGTSLAVVATLRPWPGEAAAVAARLAEQPGVTLVRLTPLGEAATGRLLRARLGPGTGAVAVKRAWRLTGGNPLLLEQVVLARAQGAPLPDVDGPTTPVVDAALLGRFAGLSRDGHRCAQAAAVLGTTFADADAVSLAALDQAGAESAVDELLATGLVVPGEAEGTLAFVHPLFATGVYHALAPARRARLHRRAFELLARRGEVQVAADHALRGGPGLGRRAARVLEEVGRLTWQSGAPRAAVRYLQAAATGAAGSPEPALALALGEAQLHGGLGEEGSRTLEGLVARQGVAPDLRVRALRALGRAAYLGGDDGRGRALLEEAIATGGHGEPGTVVEALLGQVYPTFALAGIPPALELAGQARRLASRASPALAFGAEVTWAMVALGQGDPDAAAVLARVAHLAPEHLGEGGRPSWLWGVRYGFLTAATGLERFTDADRALAGALAAADRVPGGEVVGILAATHALSLARRGRLDRAARVLEAAEGPAAVLPALAPRAAVARAYLALHRGHPRDAAAWCEAARPTPTAEEGGWLVTLGVLWVAGQRLLGEGRPREAAALYDQARHLQDRAGLGDPCLVPLARHAALAYVRAGRPAAAEEVLGALTRAAGLLPCAWPRIALAAGQAALAERRGDLAAAAGLHRQALACHEGVGLELERLETLIDYGSFARRTGAVGLARRLLGEALDAAATCGAGWLGQRAQGELAVAGGRRRRPGRDPTRLTAQEARVVALAAEGATNQEIAEHLVVSINTVETHLRHVYRKVGVRGRRELRAVPGLDGAPDGHG